MFNFIILPHNGLLKSFSRLLTVSVINETDKTISVQVDEKTGLISIKDIK